jgi:D-2-hydroxyacid dehydrogenase (NADP+)
VSATEGQDMHIVLLEIGHRYHDLEKALTAFPGAQLHRVGSPQEIAAAMPAAEILIASNRLYTPENAKTICAHANALKWIQFSTSGIDKAQACGLPSGVIVTNASGLRAFAVAEHAFALMLGLVRRLPDVAAAKREKVWRREEITPHLDNLSGKHMVLIGLGAIGQEIARKAKAFDMTVTGISRTRDAVANIDRIRPRNELQAAAAEADIMVVAAISNEETDKIVSRAVIGAMKPNAYVINIARGALIDEPALIEALQTGRIAGAGLDVAATEPLPKDHPFWTMPNVLISPHIGGAGGQGDTHAGFVKIFIDNLRRFVDKKPLTKVVIEKTP